MADWEKVVFAADLKECDCCEDIWCDTCQKHYADCSCVGPTMEGYEYEERKDGLYARKIPEEGEKNIVSGFEFVNTYFHEQLIFADASEEPKLLNYGDYVRRVTRNPNHGEWTVQQIICVAGHPVLSYCYSQKGKILPNGMTRCLLADLYDTKELLWKEDKKPITPFDDDIILLKPEEVDQSMLPDLEMNDPRTKHLRSTDV
jgi:hypothetical protein